MRDLSVIDAVKFTARMFRVPTADGYGETLDFGAADTLVPLFAPPEFALRLDELELMQGRSPRARWPNAHFAIFLSFVSENHNT
jgi:hypothetical protein